MSGQMKHTPGPWSAMPGSSDGMYVQDARGFDVCILSPRASAEKEANARFIAHAPAMELALSMIAHGVARLERCGPLVEFCYDGLRFSVGDNWTDLMDLIGWDVARAAIAKAAAK